MNKYPVLLPLLCLALACAPREPAWLRPGAPPLFLEEDQADCRASAQALAASESVSGREPLPESRRRVYLNCMASRGWKVPGNTRTNDCPSAPSLTGIALKPPDGFVLNDRAWRGLGPVSACVYVYQGPESAILRLEVQAAENGFVSSDAPVDPALVLVDRGQELLDARQLQWAVAAGKSNGIPVAAFTAFVLDGTGKERLAVSFVAPLEHCQEPIPPGLRLPHAQREAALELARVWREWLAHALATR